MRAVSVLPTPEVPTSRKTPIGRRGSVRPARLVRMACAMASRAWLWPTTRRSIASRRLSTVRISSVCIRPAGMPVHASTIAAIAWPSTMGKIERLFALQRAQARRQVRELGALGLAVALAGTVSGAARGRCGGIDLRAHRIDLGHEIAFGLPAFVQLGQFVGGALSLVRQVVAPGGSGRRPPPSRAR